MAVKNPHFESAKSHTRTALQRCVQFVEGTAFWTAIVLPFSYIPMMYLGVNSVSGFVTFIGLIGLNVLAFAIGSGHRNVEHDVDGHDPERADDTASTGHSIAVNVKP